MRKYPLYYYLILAVAFLVAVAFWILVLLQMFKRGNATESILVSGNNISFVSAPVPIDKIEKDEESRRNVVSNILNIAVKDTANISEKFISDFDSKYQNSNYKIIYADSAINYFQVEIPDGERISFKKKVKEDLQQYKLLVWDEAFFSGQSATPTDWFITKSGIDKIKSTVGEDKVKIAVVDNGFDLKHETLTGKNNLAYNATDGSNNVMPSSENHGTHTASLAAGKQTQNFRGVCEECQIIPVKAQDINNQMTTSYIIKGILYSIKNGAKVINLSLGANLVNEPIPLEIQQEFIKNGAKDEEEFWNDLFAYAEEKQVLCVLAAGNSHLLTGFDPFQRSPYTIKVGAMDESGNITDFSNYGAHTTLYAPGANIYAAKPGNAYEALNGTSMAAPLVSGFLAVLKARNPTKNNQEIRRMLMENTVDINGNKILFNKNLN